MPTTSYTFTNAPNYTNSNTEVVGGVAKLTTTTQAYNYPVAFTVDTGMTYDSSKSEFVAGVARQKDQTLTNSLLYNNFATKDAVWSSGSGVGTLGGTASISAGVLNITSGSNNYLEYSDALNMPSGNTGCVRFTFTPSYSGTSPTSQYIFASSSASNNINNLVRLQQIGTLIRLDIYSSTGVSIITSQTGNTFNPVAGTPYEFELNWDVTLGETRLFIDGVLLNGVKAGTGTMGSKSLIRLGRNYTSGTSTVTACTYDNLIIFDTVQHTANYTPGATLPENKYLETTITTPELAHTGPGTITAINSFASVNSSAKFSININQSGNYLYWNGSTWVTSNGTYAQSTDATTFNANVASLPVSGASYGQFRVYFPNQNTQGSITSITANIQENSYNASGWVKTLSGIDISSITNMTETVTKPTNTNIKYAIDINGSPKYWNGTAWATSDLSSAQFSTLADINTNLATLTSANAVAKFYASLSTTDEKVTPQIDELVITYNFGGVVSDTPETCVVYGYVRDLAASPISGVTVTVQLSEEATEYREAATSLVSRKSTTTTDVNGYWALTLIRSSEFEGVGTYSITFVKSGVLNIKTNNGNPITFSVPDSSSVELSTLLTDV